MSNMKSRNTDLGAEVEMREGGGTDCTYGEVWSVEGAERCRESDSFCPRRLVSSTSICGPLGRLICSLVSRVILGSFMVLDSYRISNYYLPIHRLCILSWNTRHFCFSTSVELYIVVEITKNSNIHFFLWLQINIISMIMLYIIILKILLGNTGIHSTLKTIAFVEVWKLTIVYRSFIFSTLNSSKHHK